MRLRRQREVAIVVAAFVIKRLRTADLSRRQRDSLFDMMEKDIRCRLAAEGWEKYA